MNFILKIKRLFFIDFIKIIQTFFPSLLFFQSNNKKYAEEAIKSHAAQADFIAQKLESKLQGSSGIEATVSKALNELKSSLKELHSNSVSGGLSDADKSFLKEISNETRDAITDMRLEVLTASDKSELRFKGWKIGIFKLIFLSTF